MSWEDQQLCKCADHLLLRLSDEVSEDDLLVMSVEPGLGAGETCGQLPSPDKELCVLCGQEEDPARRRQCYQVKLND